MMYCIGKWRVISWLLLILTIIISVILGTILLSDGGNFQQYKTDMLVKQGSVATEDVIDWNTLQKQNEDIYAWIEIPGTSIDYPVLQSAADQEEDYYLNHNIHNQYEFAGSIYSQKVNKKDFYDPVTILYGHNMINGTMFSGIRNFENPDFFRKHDTILIYLPGKIMRYKIVSYYVTDNTHLINFYRTESEDGFQKYLSALVDKSKNYRDGIQLDTDNHILTLSTCSSIGEGRRLLHGVLIEEQPINKNESEELK